MNVNMFACICFACQSWAQIFAPSASSFTRSLFVSTTTTTTTKTRRTFGQSVITHKHKLNVKACVLFPERRKRLEFVESERNEEATTFSLAPTFKLYFGQKWNWTKEGDALFSCPIDYFALCCWQNFPISRQHSKIHLTNVLLFVLQRRRKRRRKLISNWVFGKSFVVKAACRVRLAQLDAKCLRLDCCCCCCFIQVKWAHPMQLNKDRSMLNRSLDAVKAPKSFLLFSFYFAFARSVFAAAAAVIALNFAQVESRGQKQETPVYNLQL